MLKKIPLMGLLLIVYNIVVFASGTTVADELSAALFSVTLPSGAALVIRVNHLFLLAGIVVLYLEILRSAQISRDTLKEQALSTLVFVLFLIEFIVVAEAGNATFLILTVMSLLDVIAGFTVSLSTARRDVAIGG